MSTSSISDEYHTDPEIEVSDLEEAELDEILEQQTKDSKAESGFDDNSGGSASSIAPCVENLDFRCLSFASAPELNQSLPSSAPANFEEPYNLSLPSTSNAYLSQPSTSKAYLSQSLTSKDNVTDDQSELGVSSNDTDENGGWDVEEIDIDAAFNEDLSVTPKVSSDYSDCDSNSLPSASQTSSSTNIYSRSGWPSWNSWGGGVLELGTNLISTATEGVTGITNIIQNTIKAPDPQELAEQISSENPRADEEESSVLPIDPAKVTDLVNNLFGGVSTLGTKVISGGLDTLETIGKKTIDATPFGDPELRRKGTLFQGEKINLSEALREAREKNEVSESTGSSNDESDKRAVQYENAFDDTNGSLYLEALKMTSDECQIKLNCLRDNTSKCTAENYREAVKYINQLYQNNSYDSSSNNDLQNNLNLQEILDFIKETLSLNINFDGIREVYSRIVARLDDPSSLPSDSSGIHSCAITDMAQLTAHSMGVIHRMSELILIQKEYDVDLIFEGIARFVATVKSIISKLSESYAQKLNNIDEMKVGRLINNIFLEDTQSASHLDRGLELFNPILQFKELNQNLHTSS